MNGLLTVLLVEDSATDADLVVLELCRYGFDVVPSRVDNLAGLEDALMRRWELVICALALASLSASDVIARVRAADPAVPLVVLSGTIDEVASFAPLKAGTPNVVPKSNLAQLGPLVERALAETARYRQDVAPRESGLTPPRSRIPRSTP